MMKSDLGLDAPWFLGAKLTTYASAPNENQLGVEFTQYKKIATKQYILPVLQVLVDIGWKDGMCAEVDAL